MWRNDKERVYRSTALVTFFRSVLAGDYRVSDMLCKFPMIILYAVGAIWIATKQDAVRAFAHSAEIFSPLLLMIFHYPLLAYLVAGMIAIPVLLLYPVGRKRMEGAFLRIGMVNTAGETPRLLRKKRDRQNRRITVWVFDPNGISLREWQDKQAKIETILNITIADLRYSRGKHHVCIYAVPAESDLPEKLKWKEEYLLKESFALLLGEGFTGPVSVNLTYTPHVLLGGSTGSGKSVLLKLLLMQALRKGAEVYISDFKGGVDFPQIWNCKCKLCFEEESLLQTLNHLVDALEQRKQLFRSLGCANIDIYNEVEGCSLPRMIFACDEVAEVLDRTGADAERKKLLAQIESKLSTIARQGRAFGIHLILATQRPDATVIPGQIRSNLDCRICGRADNILSQIILDNTSAAEQIPKDARGRFITGDGTVFQGYLFDEREL